MNRRRLPLQRLALLLSMWVCASFAGSAGCKGCNEAERAVAIAKLSALVGDGVTRDYAKAPLAWEHAVLGGELALGDGARTDAKSTAELTFADGATLQLKPGTTVRLFLDNGKAETGLDVESGEAVLHSGHHSLQLRTHVGLATIAPDSEVFLRRHGDALGFAVALGQLNFRDREAGEVGLAQGDTVDIGIGMAVLDLKRAAAEPAPKREISVDVLGGLVQGRSAAGIALGVLKKGPREIEPGSELRLGPGAEVLVKRGADRVHLHGPGDFSVALETALAESRRGAMSLEAMEVDVEVKVPGGVIIARRANGGSQAEVTVGESDGRLKVVRGSAQARLFGSDEQFVAGAERSWSHGAALLEPVDPGAITPGPSSHHMAARAGESFVVHTPSAPVAVGFDVGTKCTGEALLELTAGHQQSRGTGTLNLAFPVGAKGYSLRCVGPNGAPGKQVARGMVTVLVDAGTRKLPPRAPTSNIDADGRTYTIYYQNQLPEIAVRWTNAPALPKYLLEVDGKPMEVSTPEHTFKSGSLQDGTHALSFSAEGRRSRTTTVEVSFDNAAPKASLSSPDDRGFAVGDTVTVEGLALPTWKVSLDGGTIAMTGGERFSGQVHTSTEHPDIAVRLSHPRLGTHYYLRRASGSP
ncbi:MAG: hypothetical protein JWN48_2591 [Myxococcaceae bacterium]|nr:hypothetical protein [Myxococcaceae bacterium]